MTANLGQADRLARPIIGVALMAVPFMGLFGLFASTGWVVASVIVGAVLVLTAVVRFCPIYRVFGLRTCRV